MKTKITYLILMLLAVVFFGCKKEKVEDDTQREVSFAATHVDPTNGLKAADVQCTNNEPTNAHVVIGGTSYDPAVYSVGGKLYTQSIKLNVGAYVATEFFLYKESGASEGYDSGDQIIMATPEAGSAFAAYTTPVLPISFTVANLAKTEVAVQVLCFDPANVGNFGFNWFAVGQVVVREAAFYGDLCVSNPALYAGSIYATNGVNVDEVAAIKVIVKRNGVEVPGSPFMNTFADPLLRVKYPDYDGQVDNYTFELQVWVPTSAPGIFEWQTYVTKSTTDALPISGIGSQGVFDFVIGNCSPNSTNKFSWLPSLPAPPQTANWHTFMIRNNNATITSPWDADMNITENFAGDGFSAATPRASQKVGYGTHKFDGVRVNKIESVYYNVLALPRPGVMAYINMWVTDGTHYAVIASENVYIGTDFQTRQEWKVFETDFANLNWLFAPGTGTGARDSNQYLTLDGVKVTLADLGANIILGDPGTYPSPMVGFGAPRGGYGFQLIYGDSQANFVGQFSMNHLTTTVDGVIYNATN